MFGLDAIGEDRKVQVPLRDLVFIRQALGEVLRFFGQPSHYPDLKAVENFLQDEGEGAFEVLREAYDRRFPSLLPKDIQDLFQAGHFDHPLPPAYHDEGA